MNGNQSPLLNDGIYGGRQSRHVIPMSMTHCNTLDLAHPDPEIGAIAHENASLGSGVEQQDMP
jgi:hypothetical protein